VRENEPSEPEIRNPKPQIPSNIKSLKLQ